LTLIFYLRCGMVRDMQKQKTASVLLMLLAACTFEQQNGDLRAKPAGMFADQSWDVTERSVTQDNDRICTVSAGELDVTQHLREARVTVQVAVSRPLDPGSRYSIIIGNQRYETPDDYFSPLQSQAIIRDFKRGETAYTEWREFGAANGRSWHWNTNKVPLEGFAPKFDSCTRFLNPRR
jgi:hypothetical protein